MKFKGHLRMHFIKSRIKLSSETKRCLSYKISFLGRKTKIFPMALKTLGLEYKHNEKNTIGEVFT